MHNYKIIMNDELYHHGILGQKWGVRRYQNKDGSLTEEGKARIRNSGSYLNPPRKRDSIFSRDSTTNRDKVAKDFTDEFWKTAKYWSDKKGRTGEPYDHDIPWDVDEKIWKKFYHDYAKATLKDLNLEPTYEAINYVKNKFIEDDKPLTEIYDQYRKVEDENVSKHIVQEEFSNKDYKKFLKESVGITDEETLAKSLKHDPHWDFEYTDENGNRIISKHYTLDNMDSDHYNKLTERQKEDKGQFEYIVDYERDNNKVKKYMFNWI